MADPTFCMGEAVEELLIHLHGEVSKMIEEKKDPDEMVKLENWLVSIYALKGAFDTGNLTKFLLRFSYFENQLLDVTIKIGKTKHKDFVRESLLPVIHTAKGSKAVKDQRATEESSMEVEA